jgi:hypothetical protein
VIVGWNDTTKSVFATQRLPIGSGSNKTNHIAHYYAKNIAGGSNTVPVMFSGSTAYPDIRILEYSVSIHPTPSMLA